VQEKSMLTSALAQIVVDSNRFGARAMGAKRLSTPGANRYKARLPALSFAYGCHHRKAEEKGQQGCCYGDAQGHVDLMPRQAIQGIDFDQIAQKLVDAVERLVGNGLMAACHRRVADIAKADRGRGMTP
jgi:hypothetical protein